MIICSIIIVSNCLQFYMLLIARNSLRILSRFCTQQMPMVKSVIEELQKQITNKQDVENNIWKALEKMKGQDQAQRQMLIKYLSSEALKKRIPLKILQNIEKEGYMQDTPLVKIDFLLLKIREEKDYNKKMDLFKTAYSTLTLLQDVNAKNHMNGLLDFAMGAQAMAQNKYEVAITSFKRSQNFLEQSLGNCLGENAKMFTDTSPTDQKEKQANELKKFMYNNIIKGYVEKLGQVHMHLFEVYHHTGKYRECGEVLTNGLNYFKRFSQLKKHCPSYFMLKKSQLEYRMKYKRQALQKIENDIDNFYDQCKLALSSENLRLQYMCATSMMACVKIKVIFNQQHETLKEQLEKIVEVVERAVKKEVFDRLKPALSKAVAGMTKLKK